MGAEGLLWFLLLLLARGAGYFGFPFDHNLRYFPQTRLKQKSLLLEFKLKIDSQ
jgi:hypothetical protein